jgi:hypothetical protein
MTAKTPLLVEDSIADTYLCVSHDSFSTSFDVLPDAIDPYDLIGIAL